MNTESQYDIAIAGGGLAGLSSAILCAKAGWKVVLFEKNTYPFHRVCGEYISNESLEFMTGLGLDLASFEVAQIKRLRVSDSHGAEVLQKLELGGFGISRYRLDHALAELAKAAGVEVHEETSVQKISFEGGEHIVHTSKGIFKTKLVIGAHGKRATLDKQLDREFMRRPETPNRNYVAVKYHVQADLPKNLIELHIFKDGYCGISSIGEEDKYCMCYLTTAENLQKSGGDIERMEAEVLSRNPFLNHYLNAFPKLYEKPLVIAQVNFNPKRCVEEHVLMAGDAAGLIPPLSGNGMSMAMHAASLLAPLCGQFLSSKISRADLEDRYSKAWRKQFNLRLHAGRTLQHLFFKEKMIHVTLSILDQSDWLSKQLIRLTHGSKF